MFNKYLIEFIIYLILFSFTSIMIPICMYIIFKDFRAKQRIANSNCSYLHFNYKPSKIKTVLFYFGNIFMAVALLICFKIIMIPMYMDLPSLVSGNYKHVEGIVYRNDPGKGFSSIYINGSDVPIKEAYFFKSNISENCKYKISFLKHSGLIIKADKIE
ncbi:hypothetical protein JHL18_06260 [Clostridium sp. YIM B02505]|uniref:Uncharacterized protein n=1 Tax=Clostridium yunnanense TaxID=2800325 RepID=A0ABS1ELM6_9CLOT|nr:hypothetical protein [Clostridium yunnanense]MBK1810239.1 hypothetical protein [Clostridium yunnanense]